MRKTIGWSKTRPLYREGEGEGGGAGGAGTGQGTGAGTGQGTGTGAGTGTGGEPEPKFTQKQVDEIVQKRLARDKDDRKKLIDDLTKFRESSQLSEQEKQSLSEKIEGLEASMRTAKEQAEYEKKTLEGKLKTETESLSKEANTWKSRFFDSTIKRALTDGAVQSGAEYPDQFVMMFQNSTRLEEEKGEDGKLTGTFIPKIKFQWTDAEGKTTNFDLPTSEAFSKMKELGMHKNLFKHGATSGTGEAGSGKGGNGKPANEMPDRKDYSSDDNFSKAYQIWRSKYNIDGTERKKE